MSFGESVRYCLSHLNDYQGRARKSEFWWFYLFMYLASSAVSLVLVLVIFVVMAATIAGTSSDTPELGLGGFVGLGVVYILLFAFSGVMLWMMLAAQARRLHDAGYSAQFLWFHLAGLGIVPLIMCIMDGQPYANQWGPDPKAGERGAYPFAAAGGYPPPPVYPPAPPAASPVAPGAPGADPFAGPTN